ncbi:hypothetical protein CI238_13143 [Colletotrichum incanum]|uniref:Uncharacterized protein n=1 Tax=Colletotrichum incanum TaxID=1573173 RepID=A0A167DIS5_COLIC|nr:hypothetical protein CI238_13143 [Colletotrichum incanum]
MPCTYCFKSNKVCKMAEESSRYGECIRTGRSQCDGNNVISAYKFFFFRVSARQKRFLKDCGSELIRRRMQSLDELEAKDKEVADIEARVERDLVA